MKDCADTTAGGPVLSDAQFEALMAEIHAAIEEAAVEAVEALGPDGKPDPIYPPGVALTEEERAALAAVNPGSALRKLIADAAAKPMFRLFALLDGLADPDVDDFWPPWELVESENGELFYENWLGGSRS
jgi:hypothetical protein